MKKNLAIKSHKTRSEEVIEILEMLGGKNVHNLTGDETMAYYIIENKEIKGGIAIFGDEPYIFFTLEEFLEKYPYKVGDKVNYVKYNDGYQNVYTIQKVQWTGVTIEYLLDSSGFGALTKDLQPYKEETLGECIEKTINECLSGKKETMEEIKLHIPEGYEFFGVDDNKVVLKLKESKYPKTYTECCAIVGNEFVDNDVIGYRYSILCQFQMLLVCRDAYWKIAGEEIGLGKPWEPAIQDIIWGITRSKDEVEKYSCHYGKTNILEFPTSEMRDAFYENFKDLIEDCKELL